MQLSVEYKDQNGLISNRSYTMSMLAFAKHFAIAGQRYAPTSKKFLKMVGMFLHYSDYLNKVDFYKNKFSLPPDSVYDPTEKGQFSNLAGKAIADFLSKKIDQSIYTVNYEAAMKLQSMPLNVARPDLLAYSTHSMFAIEAKGYSAGAGDMIEHKRQSMTGGIPVNFTVACVSHNLYSNVHCKYHDPYNENIPYDNESLQELTKKYYLGLSSFLKEDVFSHSVIEVNGEEFYEIPLFPMGYRNEYIDFHMLGCFNVKIILPINIIELSENGVSRETLPFEFNAPNNHIYIDNDRVGLSISNLT